MTPTLTEAVTWVKDALGRKKSVIESQGFYWIADGVVMATDGNFTAGHPVDVTVRAVAAGDALESALSVMSNDVGCEIADGKLVVRSGKMKASIQTLPPDSWGGVRPENLWKPAPDGLADALRLVKGFISTSPTKLWQGGVNVSNGHCTAANFAQLARAQMSRFDDTYTRDVIMPPYACDFVVSHGQPKEWFVTESYVAFRWESGAWMRSQLISDVVPDVLESIIKKAGEAQHPISDELRSAIDKVAKVTDAEDPIIIYANRVEGGGKNISMTDEATAVVPDPKAMGGGEPRSMWTKKLLAPVLELATHINLNQCPEPSAWKGQGVFGILMGRRS